VHVSETGWPSKGNPNEADAPVENACAYNRNLLLQQAAGEGHAAAPRGLPLRALQREHDARPGIGEELRPVPARRHHGLQHRPLPARHIGDVPLLPRGRSKISIKKLGCAGRCRRQEFSYELLTKKFAKEVVFFG
jgi:hypothetical protein